LNSTRPFLIIQLRPEDGTSDSEFEAILKYGGLHRNDVCRMRIERNGIPSLNIEDFSAVIVGGSPFDISTPSDEKSAIQNKIESDFKRLFDQIVPADYPFLGACSGNGLLGNYLGTRISAEYAEPVGGATVTVTEQGKQDPLLHGFPDEIRVLLGHKEACDDLPDGATLLIQGDQCPVQMFRVGENVYATQFHPEADSQGFTLRINTYRHHGYFQSHEAQTLIKAVNRETTPYANTILKRFVDRYR